MTGAPGAGKTLVGLNVATARRELGDARAVFLSGNQPLVSVLREALTRDELRRRAPGTRKGAVLQEVKGGSVRGWKPLREAFSHWRTYVSSQLSGSEYAASDVLGRLDGKAVVTRDDVLHLATSMRSFRSEKVSAFVKALLDYDAPAACATLNEVMVSDHVLLTRARQGMVIFVPHGDAGDHTRRPEYYDETFSYLSSLGIGHL